MRVWNSSASSDIDTNVEATSQAVDMSTISGSFEYITFTFDNAVTLGNGYIVGIFTKDISDGSTSKNLGFGEFHNASATIPSGYNLQCLEKDSYSGWSTVGYPTLITPDAIFDSAPTIAGLSKKRFVENFSGGSLDTDRWQQTQSGTGTFAMSDSVDGGFTLYPASGNTNYAQINFNNKKHYSKTGSVLISVWKQPTNTGGASTMQMASVNGTSWNTNSCGTRLWTTDSYFKLRTADASTVSQTDTTVARDTNFNLFKHEMKPSSAELSINGVFQLSKTTNLPTSDLQPAPFAWNENGNRDYLHIRYMEAYNT